MNLELDHFFILVEPGAKVAEHLISLGMKEGASNTHSGQGTANRRFYFSNSMLELLWVRDEVEANNGPGHRLGFPVRAVDPQASPFGLIFTRTDNESTALPFSGWSYQPDYFPPPQAFHVGDNSNDLSEPLCFYVPFVEPRKRKIDAGTFGSIKEVRITTPTKQLSNVLMTATQAHGLTIQRGEEHLMEITFVGVQEGRVSDLRPTLPIIICW